MRFKINQQQKEQTLAFIIAGLVIVSFYFMISYFGVIRSFFNKTMAILLPFVVGFAIAFVVTPLMQIIENKVLSKLKIKSKYKRVIAAITTIFIVIAGVSLSIYILLPQLISSINTLIILLPDYLMAAEAYLQELILELNISPEFTNILIGSGEEILHMLAGIVREYLPQVITYSIQIANFLFRIFLGLMIALYILIDRERFAQQFRKMTYAFLSPKGAAQTLRITRLSAKTFKSFIIGKSIDSIIVGMISFLVMTIFNWPYAILISFIIGITNMIPVLGPFIGAIPSIFILFIVDPMVSLWFLVFIILLQQLDGNVIGPMVLGDSMGLPGLWIMFAIVIGGGFFGILGMFVGVPIFAVIYTIIKEIVDQRLIQKNIDLEIKNTSE
ncbi:MAG: AI-2E family transporter [Erysipelothrix sp.]|nr:AI-2E family transporter [Erysipelothrix sp.]